jgi:hypothetical protein
MPTPRIKPAPARVLEFHSERRRPKPTKGSFVVISSTFAEDEMLKTPFRLSGLS